MLEGSVITGNRNTTTASGSFGGGVRNTGTFNMTGGIIYGNIIVNGDGAGVYPMGAINIGGTAQIIDNIKASGEVNNLYLTSGRTVGFTAAVPSNGMNIGITTADPLDALIANNASGYGQYFFADNPILGISQQGSSLVLGVNGIYNPANVVVVDMYSTSAANGWSNARLRIFINGSEITDVISIPANYSRRIYYFTVEPDDNVQLLWTKGSNDSQCSFIVYYADIPSIPSSTQSTWSTSGALLFRLSSSLSNVNNGNMLGSFMR